MQKVCEDTRQDGTTGKSAQCGSLTLTVCWKFVHVSLDELLLGVFPRSGMFAPERVVARSFSMLRLIECIFQCECVKITGEHMQ